MTEMEAKIIRETMEECYQMYQEWRALSKAEKFDKADEIDKKILDELTRLKFLGLNMPYASDPWWRGDCEKAFFKALRWYEEKGGEPIEGGSIELGTIES
jgi:hypothetical protein